MRDDVVRMTAAVEAPGWGDPGTIRHAELIGHTVWVVEHPVKDSVEEVTDGLIVAVERSRAARAVDLEKPEMCPIPDCSRRDHPIYELHEDWLGHVWFAGEAPR